MRWPPCWAVGCAPRSWTTARRPPPRWTARAPTAGARSSWATTTASPAAGRTAPVPGAQLLADLLRGPDRAVTLARRLLAGAWVVDDVAALPADFTGIAVTREGRVWNGGAAELRQAAEGGEERILAQRNRRDELIAASEAAVGREHAARTAAERAGEAVAAADRAREAADRALRDADRERTAAQEDARRSGWLIEQRRKAPQEGASAVRRAQLEGELAAERRVAERAARERELRARQITMLRDGAAADRALVPGRRASRRRAGRRRPRDGQPRRGARSRAVRRPQRRRGRRRAPARLRRPRGGDPAGAARAR